MKKILCMVALVASAMVTSQASANIVSVSTIMEESENGNYITDTTTYLDWLSFDETSRNQELVEGHNWKVASIELVREMVESAAQGRDIRKGTYKYGSRGSDSLYYLAQLSEAFGDNYRSYRSYRGSTWRGDMTTGYVTNENDIDGLSYVTFGQEWVTSGSNSMARVGNYIESGNKLTYLDNSGRAISYEPEAFMYRLNEEGYRAGLVSGIMRDVSAPIVGGIAGLGLASFAFVRRKIKNRY